MIIVLPYIIFSIRGKSGAHNHVPPQLRWLYPMARLRAFATKVASASECDDPPLAKYRRRLIPLVSLANRDFLPFVMKGLTRKYTRHSNWLTGQHVVCI